MNPWLALDLIGPGMTMAGGAILFWLPRKHRLRAQRRHAARLAELDAGGEETYFEERRALLAYPPAKDDRDWHLMGMVLLAAGALKLWELLFV